jgi:hypothetical protein
MQAGYQCRLVGGRGPALALHQTRSIEENQPAKNKINKINHFSDIDRLA